MNERAMSRLSFENGLRHALDRQEFVVHYQPQVSIESGRLVGMEALVRWNHPDRGLVAPGEFIPLAEDSRLIIPLGQWILATACRQAVRWHETGLDRLRVAVNLSVRQLQHPDLIRHVEEALSGAGLPPTLLELEVTESAAMQNVELTLSALVALREMGVRISMDDFGTGHSSLSHLKQFPVDAVKIDKSFVHDMTVDPYDAVIVSSVIDMAHSLRLKVLAEGVETPEQFQFLRQRGCDEAQGYLFSEPRPAAKLEGIVRTLTAP
jgi:EAL domain-containing protein (putative c-di-GMP-specific phosphodiesterase class I)